MKVELTTGDGTGQEETTWHTNQTAEQVTELLKHPFFLKAVVTNEVLLL